MAAPKPMTDRQALRLHRSRAADDPAFFLHETARDEVEDRLSVVNKSFRNGVVISGFPQFWRETPIGAAVVADSDILAVQETSLDLIIHTLALHWANDPVGQLIQCRRALKPDGLLLVQSFGGQTLSELRAALGQAEVEITGGLSPRVAPMGEIRDLGALLQRAGLALPVADSWPIRVEYDDMFHLMRDLRAMGETNALADRVKHFTRRDVLLRAAELYHHHFATSEGRVYATFEIVTLTGWAPDASQQQPLRPGSAAARLSDALGTEEKPLKP